jgi:hypothetical protein
MFYVENVTFFLEGCKALGLKGSQLFDVSDLQDVPRAREARGGALRGDHERRLRNVCITIYWLGRAAKGIADYKGPHLDESKFRELIAAHPVSGVSYSTVISVSNQVQWGYMLPACLPASQLQLAMYFHRHWNNTIELTSNGNGNVLVIL